MIKGVGIISETFIHTRIDKDLKLELQIIALKQNKSVTQIVTELIEEYVNENK